MIDLTYHKELQEPTSFKTIMTCYIRLDKKTMLDTLQSDSIYINGKHYKVPEETLLKLLLKKCYGETKLELEEIV